MRELHPTSLRPAFSEHTRANFSPHRQFRLFIEGDESLSVCEWEAIIRYMDLYKKWAAQEAGNG